MLRYFIILAAVAVWNVQSANRYLLYTRDNQRIPVNISTTDETLPELFKPEENTIILVHGHGGSSSARFNLLIMEEIFTFRDQHNVIVVDWEREASYSYSVAVSYVSTVADDLASFLRWVETTTTPEPTTPEPTTTELTTPEPNTPESTTTELTTPEPNTPESTTTELTTPEPNTPESTTTELTTPEPDTPETTTTELTTPEPDTPETTTTELTTPEPNTPESTTTELTTPEPDTPESTPIDLTTPEPDTPEPRTLHVCILCKVHLVGFGLGAHVAGIASRQLRNSLGVVGRITGLDPSGSQWGSNSQRLRENDADYVEVIHTDGSGLLANGIGTNIGQVNFHANGGSNQPGCFSHSCSHDRAFELFAATIRGGDRLVGNACSSNTQMNLNLCRGSRLEMGGTILSKPSYSSIYRVNTGRTFPF